MTKLKGIEIELPEAPAEMAVFNGFPFFNQAQAGFTGLLIPENLAQRLGLDRLSWQRIRHKSEIGHNVREDNLPKLFYGAPRDDSETPVWKISAITLAETAFYLVISSPNEQNQRTAQLRDNNHELRLSCNPNSGWETPKPKFPLNWRNFVEGLRSRVSKRFTITTG